MPDQLRAGALTDHTVLVQGGAGAVGNAAIQLARWADATVIATVSSPEKAQLAAAAGAVIVINYREQDVVEEVRKIAPDGVHTIVEVSAARNAAVDAQLLRLRRRGLRLRRRRRRRGDPADPAADGAATPAGSSCCVYTEPRRRRRRRRSTTWRRPWRRAASGSAGRPACRCTATRWRTAAAHQAVEDAAVGKVLITTAD